jgi:hypothetical protein
VSREERRARRTLPLRRLIPTMKTMLSAAIVFGVAPTIAPIATAAVIDFEAAVSDDAHQQSWGGSCCEGPVVDTPYQEDGFSIQAELPTSHLLANNPARDGIGNGPDGGSKHMATIGIPTPAPPAGERGYGLSINRQDGQLFAVQDLRLSEYSLVFDYSMEIQFIGVQSTGSIQQTFMTDGINDGAGPLADFELVLLDPAFTNLVAFEIYGIQGQGSRDRLAPFAVDDIHFTLVPEPGTALLLLLGLCGLAGRRR